MTRKRHRGEKYVHCYCEKNRDVLVGIKLNGIVHPVAATIGTAITLLVIISDVEVAVKVTVTVILFMPWLVGFFADFQNAKKCMLDAGHSMECGRKIGYYAMIYRSLWTEFKIMEKEDNGETSTLGKSKKRK